MMSVHKHPEKSHGALATAGGGETTGCWLFYGGVSMPTKGFEGWMGWKSISYEWDVISLCMEVFEVFHPRIQTTNWSDWISE